MPTSEPDRFTEVLELLGQIDVYLLDQIMKGRIGPGRRILDAGCGGGRNIRFLLRCGCDVWAVDRDSDAVESARRMARECGLNQIEDRYRCEPLEALSFDDASFDAVICNAVLHFADHEDHFEKMVDGLWRVLAPGGVFFARLASNIGIEKLVSAIDGRVCRLPDGTSRFLVDESFLLAQQRRLGASLLGPIKTVNVQGARCMTNWVLSKPPTP